MIGLSVLVLLVVLVATVLFAAAGLGSATLVIPVLVFSGLSPEEAISYGLLVNVISSSVVNIAHIHSGDFRFKFSIPTVSATFVASFIGAYLSSLINHRVLMGIFAVFLIYSSLSMLGLNLLYVVLGRRESGSYKEACHGWRVSAVLELVVLGFISGILAGMLGIGGGSILLPIMVQSGYDPKEIVPMVSFVVLMSSIGGFVSHIAVGNVDFSRAVVLGTIAFAGGIVGFLLKRKMSSSSLKKVLGVLLIIIAVKVVWKVFKGF